LDRTVIRKTNLRNLKLRDAKLERKKIGDPEGVSREWLKEKKESNRKKREIKGKF